MNTSAKDDRSKKDTDLGWIVALGVSLAVLSSHALGVGLGVGLLLAATARRKEIISLKEAGRLLLIALLIAAGCLIIRDWPDFKAGFIDGYNHAEK